MDVFIPLPSNSEVASWPDTEILRKNHVFHEYQKLKGQDPSRVMLHEVDPETNERLIGINYLTSKNNGTDITEYGSRVTKVSKKNFQMVEDGGSKIVL
mmetsp:Transcript_9410/g.14386  ORF Transcript_9410/g.14386 Transcript_9410/m.14386 type:complete len:98 (+) Transcript_9410:3908-4201(+)